jgi:hypothetical protein
LFPHVASSRKRKFQRIPGELGHMSACDRAKCDNLKRH